MTKNTQIRLNLSSWLQTNYDESLYDEPAPTPPQDQVLSGCLKGVQRPQQVK